MRSTTHQMRSDTPGENVSFAFSGVPRINSKLRHSYERDDPMSPVTTAFSSLPPPPSACVCPTTPRALFLPTLHPRYGRQGPIEWLQAPSGEFPLFGPLFANNPPPSPRATLAASTRPCTPRFKSCQPPPCKCNPQINPAPRINHPRQRNWPTKMPQQMESSAEAIDEDPAPLGKQQEIQHPPCSQVRTPRLPTNQPQMTAKTPVPSATRAPLRPTRPRPPRPHVDTQMHPNLAVDGEDSWWVHSGVLKRSCDVAPSLRIYIQLDV